MLHALFLELGVYAGKITVKYLWHIAFLDFKCIKKEPAYIDKSIFAAVQG